MITPTIVSLPAITRRHALLGLLCAFTLALVAAPASRAADKPLPLSPTFEKVESSEGTPFVLKLKNDSKETLKVSGKVLLAVVNHATDKARALPEHTLAAGEVWTITGLSADDKVLVSAAGHAQLEVRVPFRL
ncbi:MAG TPA: hypothetical protein VG734_03800 [Lacunisphaera sp.]|nr:hypothetical protein [Lacunisphaera sp.]